MQSELGLYCASEFLDAQDLGLQYSAVLTFTALCSSSLSVFFFFFFFPLFHFIVTRLPHMHLGELVHETIQLVSFLIPFSLPNMSFVPPLSLVLLIFFLTLIYDV